jgi:hypothetical protein
MPNPDDLTCPVCDRLASVDPRDGCCLDCLRRKAKAAGALAAACQEWVAYFDWLEFPSDPDDPLAKARRLLHGPRVARTRAALAAYRPQQE